MIRIVFLHYYLLILTLLSCKESTSDARVNNDTLIPTTTIKAPDSKMLASVKQGEFWGYINPKGEFVIPPSYSWAGPFSNGFACVNTGKLWEGNPMIAGTYTFINPLNEMMGWQFQNQSVFEDSTAIIRQQGKYFVINTSQGMLNSTFEFAGPFNEGLAPAKSLTTGQYGYMDKFAIFKINVNPSWQIFPFSEGFAKVRVGDQIGLMDKKGNVHLLGLYDDIFSFNNGLCRFKKGTTYGYIDKNLKILIQAQYEDGKALSEGLIPVKKSGKWGFIDAKGEIVIDFEYDDVSEFSQGLATVAKNGQYSFINQREEIVIPLKFELAKSFKNGLAVVKSKGKYGYIKKDGQYQIYPQFEDAKSFNPH